LKNEDEKAFSNIALFFSKNLIPDGEKAAISIQGNSDVIKHFRMDCGLTGVLLQARILSGRPCGKSGQIDSFLVLVPRDLDEALKFKPGGPLLTFHPFTLMAFFQRSLPNFHAG